MEHEKLLVNDKITASSQTSVSLKHDHNNMYQKLQATKMNFKRLLG